MFIYRKAAALTSITAVLGIVLATPTFAYDPASPTDPLNPANSVPKFEVTFTPPPPLPAPAETPATATPDTGEAAGLSPIFDPFGLLTPARQVEGGSHVSKVAYPPATAHHVRHHRLHRHVSGE